jgi:hypothetical protein
MFAGSTVALLGLVCFWSTYSRLGAAHYPNGTSIKEDSALTFLLFPTTPILSFGLAAIGLAMPPARLPVWLALATLAVTSLAFLSFVGLMFAYVVASPMNFGC